MKWLKEFWRLLTTKPITPDQIDKTIKDVIGKRKSAFTANEFADYLASIQNTDKELERWFNVWLEKKKGSDCLFPVDANGYLWLAFKAGAHLAAMRNLKKGAIPNDKS